MNATLRKNDNGVFIKRTKSGQPQIPNAMTSDATLAIGVRIKYWSSALGVILEAQDETGEAKKERRILPMLERREFVSKILVPFDTTGAYGRDLRHKDVLHAIKLPYETNRRSLRVALVPKLRRTLAGHVISFHIPQVLGQEAFEIDRLFAKYVSLAYNSSDAPLLFIPFIRMAEIANAMGGKLTDATSNFTLKCMVADWGMGDEVIRKGGSSLLIAKLKSTFWSKIARPGHLDAVHAAIFYETRANNGGLTPQMQIAFCESFSTCDTPGKWCEIMNLLTSRLGAM
jgi:hypothetical protein